MKISYQVCGRALLVAALLFAVYNLNFRAIGARDTMYLQYVALSLAARGDVDVTEFRPEGGEPQDGSEPLYLRDPACHAPCWVERGLREGSLEEVGGRVLSNYPIVPSIVAAPAYFVALQMGLIAPLESDLFRLNAVGKATASAFAAMTCGVLVLVLRQWVPAAPAVLVALVAGLATPLWSSASQALWSHGPAAFFLGLAFLTTSLARRRAGAFTAGVAFGLAATCRPLLILFAAGAVIGLVRLRPLDLQRATWTALGTAAVLVIFAAWNTLTFGTPMGGMAHLFTPAVHSEMHGVGTSFSGSLPRGLSGVLISPSRGLLVFSPIVILALIGAPVIWRHSWLHRWLIVLPLLGFMLGWSKYAVWWGGHSFGPRFAADIAVPLALIAAAAFGSSTAWRTASWLKPSLAVLLAWSVGVQAIGAFFHPNGDWNNLPVDVDRAHSRLWDWQDSQIWRALQAGPHTDHLDRLKSELATDGS